MIHPLLNTKRVSSGNLLAPIITPQVLPDTLFGFPIPDEGNCLLIRGQSGDGKTQLIRYISENSKQNIAVINGAWGGQVIFPLIKHSRPQVTITFNGQDIDTIAQAISRHGVELLLIDTLNDLTKLEGLRDVDCPIAALNILRSKLSKDIKIIGSMYKSGPTSTHIELSDKTLKVAITAKSRPGYFLITKNSQQWELSLNNYNQQFFRQIR